MKLRRRQREAITEQHERTLRLAGYAAAGTRCFACHGEGGQHGDHCFMRPGALTAPRGGISYTLRGIDVDPLTAPLRPGFVTLQPPVGTPIYDAVVRELGVDPSREAIRRHNDETFTRLQEQLARSFSTPGPMIVLPDAPQVEIVEPDPKVAYALDLYRKGCLGDVGTLTARRALARLISDVVDTDDAARRPRAGWGN